MRRGSRPAGAPQDIEWAFEGDRLFLLQARPITTALRAAPIADPTLTIFDNSNIVESYPGLVSPLTYSFAQYVYARVYRTLRRAARRRRGRRSARTARCSRTCSAASTAASTTTSSTGIARSRCCRASPQPRPHGDHDGRRASRCRRRSPHGIGPPPAHGLARSCANMARSPGSASRSACEALRLKGPSAPSTRGLTARCRPDAAAIARHAAVRAGGGISRASRPDLLERWDAPLINDFLCMMAFGASRKLIERWAGPAGLELHNDVMIGQGDIISAEPAQRIARMGRLRRAIRHLIAALRARRPRGACRRDPELAQEVESYIAKFGDRCTEELKLESITLAEDPGPLLMAIAAGAQMPARRSKRSTRNRSMRSSPASRLKRLVMRGVLGWPRRGSATARTCASSAPALFGRARRLFVAMGAQFHALGLIGRAARHLSPHGERSARRDRRLCGQRRPARACHAAQGRDGGVQSAARSARAAERTRAPPSAAFRARRKRRRQRRRARDAARPAAAPERCGRAPGSYAIHAPRALERGEVLVARHTDPGWIALFANASAIVVERGSLLSHSAIVARELGIPCVVGLKGAMDWIADRRRDRGRRRRRNGEKRDG